MMETTTSDIFSRWRQEGSKEIPKNFQVFQSLVLQAKEYAERGKYDAAAVYGEMAALYAACKHCGFFVSPELEEILLGIGRQAIPTYSDPGKSNLNPEKPTKILHVATSVQAIGGHSRMIWRWIKQDSSRSHSLLLTRQPRKELPENLQEAVISSGGKIYQLNQTVGTIISWAKQLRKIAAKADLVVLHIHNYDVIPTIAFANKDQSPPIILLNHADHIFWLGAGISDVVANLRESGMGVSQERRNIQPERNVLLPTILEPIQRQLSRSQAKQQLGLPEDSIVLLSVARSIKYESIDDMIYADAYVPLLEKYKQAILIVVGSGKRDDWSGAIQKTQGRIIAYPEREDTEIFYQAADIYVDSFPFVSTTSLLEAGSYGVPLVSRFPYSKASSIFGVEVPGVKENLITARSQEEYISFLSRLVEDGEFRLFLGEATRKKIIEMHWGNNWQQYLENLYTCATKLPPLEAPLAPVNQIVTAEPDVLIQSIYGIDLSLDDLIQSNLTIMPLEQRLHHWSKLVQKHGFHNQFGRFGQFRLLVPEWLYCRYARLRYG